MEPTKMVVGSCTHPLSLTCLGGGHKSFACVDGKITGGLCDDDDSTSIDHKTWTSSYWQDLTSSYKMYIPLPVSRLNQIITLKMYKSHLELHYN